jgi:hypothetical protein
LGRDKKGEIEMDETKFTFTISEDGKIYTKEYDVFIGIRMVGRKYTLQIHDKGNIPESFWLYLPDSLSYIIKKKLKK